MSAELMESVRNVKPVKFTERLPQDDSHTCAPERVSGTKMGYRYPLAEEYLGKNARAGLENSADKRLPEKGFHSRELSCPKCGPINIALGLHCPKCESGVQQQFYMIAMCGMGFLIVKVVIEIPGGDIEISPSDLFALHTGATAVGGHRLLVAILGLSQDAEGVAQTYGIAYVEAQDLQTAADGVVGGVGELVEAPEERMMQVLAGPTQRKAGGE